MGFKQKVIEYLLGITKEEKTERRFNRASFEVGGPIFFDEASKEYTEMIDFIFESKELTGNCYTMGTSTKQKPIHHNLYTVIDEGIGKPLIARPEYIGAPLSWSELKNRTRKNE